MKSVNENVQTINLDRDQILILDGGRDGRMRVLHGAQWLSAEAGRRQPAWPVASAPGAGAATPVPVVATRGPLSMQVLPGAEPALERVRLAITRLQRGIRRQVIRLQFGPTAVEPGACC